LVGASPKKKILLDDIDDVKPLVDEFLLFWLEVAVLDTVLSFPNEDHQRVQFLGLHPRHEAQCRVVLPLHRGECKFLRLRESVLKEQPRDQGSREESLQAEVPNQREEKLED
jgi:hypothetical protein